MGNKKVYYTLILLIISVSVFAQSALENTAEWTRKISEETSQINNLKAGFQQKKVLSFLENPIESTGTFWFEQENKIRWEYQTPYPYLIVMKNGILTITDEGRETTTDLSSNVMFEQLSTLIAGSIQGSLLNEDEAYRKEFFQDDKSVIVRFNPHSEQLLSYLKYIEIHFNKETLQVDELIMMEPGEDYTQIQFINSKINTEFAEDVF
jgi:outer membrane lipoprotein carrier protein